MGSDYSFPMVTLPRDRIVVVTGANRGLGYETAKWIAMLGATVILACRSVENGRKAMVKMNMEFHEEKKKGTKGLCDYDELAMDVIELDLSSLTSTKKFIEEYWDSGRNLHVLICNAGVAMCPPEITEDGYELHFQANYLGHFLLCAELLPLMEASGEDCRVILVSSFMHFNCGFDTKRIQGIFPCTLYNRIIQYSRSKLYQVMQTYTMRRLLEGSNVSICSVNPGWVYTDINRGLGDYGFLMNWSYATVAWAGFKTSYQGATVTINAAVNPDKPISPYYSNNYPAHHSSTSKNEDYQRRLWIYTLDCLNPFMKSETRKKMKTFTVAMGMEDT
ncbi:retinol dehydrogenase 11-like [Ylistrum balloti]|uniref:retinol dehydrogenase 11-like n=1 Tax=Ylistrum balloti TaxID=509963 RepID=UPI00290582FB|nr:retinol dehydrogenase 11-like [Ylistrum balloti]